MKLTSTSSHVFTLCHKAPYTRFHENLFQLLDLFHCTTSVFTKWDNALRDLRRFGLDYQLMILDPTVEGFDGLALREILAPVTAMPNPKVILVAPEIDTDLSTLERELDVDARISQEHTPYGLNFVLSRLLFDPGKAIRKNPRVLTDLDVAYMINSDGSRSACRALNLSTGGMFLHSPKIEKDLSSVEVSFALPHDHKEIKCEGTIVHTRPGKEAFPEFFPPGMGLQFKEIQPNQLQQIEQVVSKRMLRADRKELTPDYY